MLKKTSAISLLAAAGLTAGASAQVTLYRTGSHDLTALTSNPAAPEYIGGAPTAIAFDGTNLYVGGVNTTAAAAPVQIVRVNDVLGAPTYTAFPETLGQAQGLGDGYKGFDWDAASRRLLATRSATQVEGVIAGAISLLDFDATGVLTRVQGSPSINGDDGAMSGPAFDYGPAGAGFDYLPFNPPGLELGDDVVDGPAPATLVWGERPVIGMFEGLSTEPGDDDSDYILNTLPGFAYFDALGIFCSIVATSTATQWRDLDIDPSTGLIVARANNQLIVSSRNPDATAEIVSISGRITPPNGEQAAVAGQNCEIITGLDGGDLVIWNDRWSADPGKPFNLVQQATRLSDEMPVAITWLDGDGSPLTFGLGGDIPDGNGAYSYSWDAATQTLAVCDEANRVVHFFSTEPGVSPCACEFDGSQGVNVFDLLAYLDLWFASAAGADIDGTQGVNVFDLLFFLDCWFPASAGAPC